MTDKNEVVTESAAERDASFVEESYRPVVCRYTGLMRTPPHQHHLGSLQQDERIQQDAVILDVE